MKPELEISCGQCRGCHMEPTCQTGRDKTNTRRARAYAEGRGHLLSCDSARHGGVQVRGRHK